MTDYLNNSNKTTLLFKQFQNKSQAAIDVTTDGTGGTSFFNEQKKSLNNIYNTDIFIENIEKNLPDEYKLSSLDACGNIPPSVWKANISDQDYSNSSFLIPNTNLIFYKEIYLNPVSGTNNAWWLIPPGSDQITDNNLLKDMIPFNFNSISLSTFSPIVKYWNESQWTTQRQNNVSGLNWLIDYASGILQFYQNDSILNSLNIDCNSNDEKKRPKISFIKYAGLKGLENFSGGGGDTSTINITGNGATTVTGTYPNFTITSTDTNTDTNTTYSAGTGVTLSGTTFNIGQSVGTSNSVTFSTITSTNNSVFNNARIGYLGYGSGYTGFAHNSLSQPHNYAILQATTGETFINASSGYAIQFRINNGTKARIDANGLGVGGATNSSYPLYVTGTCGASNGFNGGAGGATWFGTSYVGHILPYGGQNYTYSIGTSGAQYLIGYAYSWSASSDDRLKDNETDISSALETIMKLKPQTYDFKSSEEPDAKHLGLRSGFIAQDVLQIPELVHAVNVPENETENVGKELDENGNIVDSDKEKKCYLSLDYNTIFTHAVKAIQELNEEVKNLKTKIEILEAK